MIKYFVSNCKLNSSSSKSYGKKFATLDRIVCGTCVVLGLAFNDVFIEMNGFYGMCVVCVWLLGIVWSKAYLPYNGRIKGRKMELQETFTTKEEAKLVAYMVEIVRFVHLQVSTDSLKLKVY